MMKPSEIAYAIENTFNRHIRKYAKIAGLGEFYIRPNPKAKKDKLQATLEWINDFVKNETKGLKDAWNLVPEALWRNYQMLDLDELAECKILKQAKKEFILKWKKRPHTIRQTHHGDEIKFVNIDELIAEEEYIRSDAFNLLIDSIKKYGVKDSITVNPYKGKYKIKDGKQRYYACKILGHKKMMCCIKLENNDG